MNEWITVDDLYIVFFLDAVKPSGLFKISGRACNEFTTYISLLTYIWAYNLANSTCAF